VLGVVAGSGAEIRVVTRCYGLLLQVLSGGDESGGAKKWCEEVGVVLQGRERCGLVLAVVSCFW